MGQLAAVGLVSGGLVTRAAKRCMAAVVHDLNECANRRPPMLPRDCQRVVGSCHTAATDAAQVGHDARSCDIRIVP